MRLLTTGEPERPYRAWAATRPTQSLPKPRSRRILSWRTHREPGETMAEFFLRMLLIDLEMFAAEAEVAVRAFRPPWLSTRDNTIARGLANDFFGYLDYVSEKVVAAGLVSREMLAPAHRVATTLQEMNRANGEDLWTDEAFRTRDEWTAVRRLATEAIRALGYVVEVPPPKSGDF